MENNQLISEIIKESFEEIRYSSKYKQRLTQLIFIIGTGIGIAATMDLIEVSSIERITLGVLAIVIGIIGLLFAGELHNRQQWYSERLENLYERLNGEHGNLGISDIYFEYQEGYRKNFGAYSNLITSVVIIGLGMIL